VAGRQHLEIQSRIARKAVAIPVQSLSVSRGGFLAYYRVSTGKQRKSGLGLEAQRQAVANYLNGGNWRIVGPVPLVVAKVDRLTRSVAFLSRLLEAGVDVRFADLPMIEGATGRFLLQQMQPLPSWKRG
jgi:hypothetical protein